MVEVLTGGFVAVGTRTQGQDEELGHGLPFGTGRGGAEIVEEGEAFLSGGGVDDCVVVRGKQGRACG